MTELYNQFNMAFPVFNTNDKYEDINEIQGDCYLKKNLCKEVELVNPIVEKNKINNNIDNINKAMNEMNLKIITKKITIINQQKKIYMENQWKILI